MPRVVLLLLISMGTLLLAPFAAPYDIRGDTLVTDVSKQPPSLAHPMGTDGSDRDLLSLVLKGSQTSIIIASGAVFLSLLVGVSVGTLAAFSGGWIDTMLMRLTDVTLSIPRFLILLCVVSLSAGHLNAFKLILLIGLTGWFDICRLIRGEVAGLLNREWVLAAHAAGARQFRIAHRHILPHLLPIIVVVVTLGIGRTIVLEAALMYLGAGVGGSSLGSLLREGSGVMITTWWLTVFPGLAIVLIVLAFNALGEALRDILSPEQVLSWPTS